ncbi:hypothetical protein H9P43_009888 [Blastocladiella emersonii ATCC 22665]|nr:hypothetical protein H9P43_009888 [Blastocladiella emersonii ATCC 22665]
MDALLDRLRLLSYSRNFCAAKGFKQLDPQFFAQPHANVTFQLNYFYALFAWLAGLCGDAFAAPSELDDPNVAATNVGVVLRNAGVQGDYSPAKLRAGHGEAVLAALMVMADRALKATGFKFLRPVFEQTEQFEEAEADDHAEVRMDDVEEAMFFDDNEGSENEDADDVLAGILNRRTTASPLAGAAGSPPLRPTTAAPMGGGSRAYLGRSTAGGLCADPAAWRAEVERVTPQLRVVLANDHKHWRLHVSTLVGHQAAIGDAWEPAKAQLAAVAADLEQSLEKLRAREAYVNTQLDPVVDAFKGVQSGLTALKQKYAETSEAISAAAGELAAVTGELDAIKAQMDDLGSGMTDSKPLLNIKSALTRLKAEIKAMDVRTGVLEHTLLNGRIRTKANLVTGANDSPTLSQLFMVM